MKPVLLAIFALSVLVRVVSGADWPLYRGPNGDGVLTETAVATDWPQSGLTKLWSIPLHDDGKNTHAGASIVNGRVYVPSRTGTKDVIYCLDAEDGKQIWSYSYESSGKPQTYGTGIRAAPTVFGGFVYTLGCYGQVYCLNADKGTLVWNVDLLKDFNGTTPKFGMAAAPVVMNGMLICEPGGKGASIVALDPATGKTIWQSGDGAASYAVPQKLVLDGVEQVLAYMEAGLVGVELKTGKELWRFEYAEEREKNIPQPIISGNTIYFSNNTLGFSAIQVALTGSEWKVTRLWSARKEKLHYSSPVLGAGCLYYQNSKRELHCMDAKDGSVLWAARNIGMDFATLIRLDEHNLLAALDDGYVALLEVSAGASREKARFQATDKCFLQAAIADKKLFVRDHEKLICYSLSPGQAEAKTAVATNPEVKSKKPNGVGDRSFLGAWESKHSEYYVTWLVGLALAIVGVVALSRRELLPAAITGEAATFGMGLAMLVDGLASKQAGFYHSSKFYMWAPIVAALIFAAIVGIGRKGRFQTVTQWITTAFLTVGIVALALWKNVATIDMNVVLWSSEIGGTRSEVTILSIAAAVTVLAAIFIGLKLARTLGENSVAGSILLPLWFAFVIGLSVRSTGTLFLASCLLLPPLFARTIVSTLPMRMVVAVVVALAATTAGWVIAPHYLCSFAVPASAIMAACAILAAAVGALTGRREAAVTEAHSS